MDNTKIITDALTKQNAHRKFAKIDGNLVLEFRTGIAVEENQRVVSGVATLKEKDLVLIQTEAKSRGDQSIYTEQQMREFLAAKVLEDLLFGGFHWTGQQAKERSRKRKDGGYDV